MPLGFERINERQSRPNASINFVGVISTFLDQDVRRLTPWPDQTGRSPVRRRPSDSTGLSFAYCRAVLPSHEGQLCFRHVARGVSAKS